jgi:hypothetical protein
MTPRAENGQRDNADDVTEISDDERDEIVDELIDDMAQLFRGYVRGELAFEDLSFELFDTLRTLNALATGDVIIEYEEDLGGEYDEFDELAGEPTGESSPPSTGRSSSGNAPSRPGHKPKKRS